MGNFNHKLKQIDGLLGLAGSCTLLFWDVLLKSTSRPWESLEIVSLFSSFLPDCLEQCFPGSKRLLLLGGWSTVTCSGQARLHCAVCYFALGNLHGDRFQMNSITGELQGCGFLLRPSWSLLSFTLLRQS